MKTLEEMKEQYDNVKLIHLRQPTKNHNGQTVAIIWDGPERFIGVSQCSKKDQFSKKMGRMVALNRAEHVAKEMRNSRARGKLSNFLYKINIDEPLHPDLKEIPKSLYVPKRRKE